jgi:hypothetical protein
MRQDAKETKALVNGNLTAATHELRRLARIAYERQSADCPQISGMLDRKPQGRLQ